MVLLIIMVYDGIMMQMARVILLFPGEMIREGEEGQGWDEATSAAATFVNQPVFDPKVSNRVADRSWCYICEVTSFKLARLGWREKLRHLWNNQFLTQKSQTALQRQELLHLWILFEIRSTWLNVNNWVWPKSKLVKPELWPWIEHLKRVSRLRTQKHLKRVSWEATSSQASKLR